MDKLDKVIRALECCLDSWDACADCYLNDCKGCRDQLNADALEVLRNLKTKYATAVEAAAIATELAAKYRKTDGDLISRSELYGIESLLMTDVVENDPVAKFVLDQVLHDIQSVPSVEAELVVHAHWVYDPNGCDWGIGAYRCSSCGCKNDSLPCNEDAYVNSYACAKRCPHCGAHMDEEVADGT